MYFPCLTPFSCLSGKIINLEALSLHVLISSPLPSLPLAVLSLPASGGFLVVVEVWVLMARALVLQCLALCCRTSCMEVRNNVGMVLPGLRRSLGRKQVVRLGLQSSLFICLFVCLLPTEPSCCQPHSF